MGLFSLLPRRRTIFAARFGIDLTLLLCGFLLGAVVSGPADEVSFRAAALLVGSHLVAVVATRGYRTPLSEFRLRDGLRLGGAIAGAWTAVITGLYLVTPAQLPARGLLVVYGLFSLVAILGVRALGRYAVETHLSPGGSPTPPPSPPSLTLGDLRPRSPAPVDTDALRDALAGRSVLVTGAGGSIGSALSTQLLDLNPFRLSLVDVSEYNLYRLENTLRARPYEGELDFCIGDVRDEATMDRLFEHAQPDLVLHTAAYKHVPLLERHPTEAFRNNTMGTVVLKRLCEAHGVDQFLFTSTDKAVEPTSVLGATKKWAEGYVQAATSPVRRKIVRFGNVFASQGSVVPRFERQLANGGPVTVTHPDMERYFMSTDEACGLILQTLLLDEAPVYCFDMGEPVKIVRLARALIRRWYPSVDPDSMIEYVGRRPGEKLTESLRMPHEAARSTSHGRIVGLHGTVPHSRAELDVYFRRLLSLAEATHDTCAHMRRALFTSNPGAVPREPST